MMKKWLTAAIIALIASSSAFADPPARPFSRPAPVPPPNQVRVAWIDAKEVENAYIVETATTTSVVGQVGSTPANGISLTTTPPLFAPKAFPTAEGFGATTIGGRGGAVYIVRNLANSGAGSLRACAEASGRRTCVFHISGTIPLVTPIAVRQPFLTIAGQTSPHGIALKVATGNVKGTFEIWAHDVIIRHVRFRPGPSSMTTDNNDALVVQPGVYNVIVDHCSFSWSTDEIVNTLGTSEDKPGSERITFQWSMFYEGLSHSTHVSGEHSKGPFFFGRKITFHHNLIASNTMRNPNLTIEGRFDYLNNVVYNAIEMFVIRPL